MISSRMGGEEKISENKVKNSILKTKFFNVTYGLNTLLTDNQPTNWFHKENITWNT